MAAIDSLLSIVEFQKADGIVIVGGESPSLLGGKSGQLTMPPLNETMMSILLGELLEDGERESLAGGTVIERPLPAMPGGIRFNLSVRQDGSKIRIVVRKGAGETTPRAVPPRTEPETVSRRESTSESVITTALSAAIKRGASDLILSAGRAPQLKLAGVMEGLPLPDCSDTELRVWAEHVGGKLSMERLEATGSTDFAIEHGPKGRRFRANVFVQRTGLAAVLRPIWDTLPTLETLGLPRGLLRTTQLQHGLVLLAGATGSGKSTTLAALVDHISQTRACHIVTLEDPIEYVYTSGRAIVHQREVGTHVDSFATGLRAALRESPDVLLVGEMRDAETVRLALQAAETGHLVFSTLHAATAAGAIERITNAIPDAERSSVRTQLASALRFVLTQQILPAIGGGRVPAIEVMAVNHAVAAQIREGRTQLLNTQIELGVDDGMITLEQAMAELVRNGRITQKTAAAALPGVTR